MLKPLAGFLFKLLLEKLNWILRQVRLRTGVKCPWCCWPCSGTKFFTPVAHIPLKTLLITNLSEVWVQKTQIEITLWCKRLNEWLILLWQLGVVCRSQPHCDYIIYSSHCWSSCSYQTLLFYKYQGFSQHSLCVLFPLHHLHLGPHFSLLKAENWSQILSWDRYPLPAQSLVWSHRDSCELTEPRECWNPSYKAGTLVLSCSVKCFALFLSLQCSRKFLNHSETSGIYYLSFYRRKTVYSL